MSELGELLRELRGNKTLREAAKETGLSHTYISDIEKGFRRGTKTPISPSPDTLKRFSDAYHYPYEKLMRKAGYMETLKEEDAARVKQQHLKFEYVPILGTIRAGEPIDRIEHTEGYELVEPFLLRGREAFILKVQGDSMIGDRIYDGDRVLCVVQEEVSTSDIAVVAVNGDEATLKRVKCEGAMCMLIPSNPNMSPMLKPSKDVHIIGKVIEVRHSLE